MTEEKDVKAEEKDVKTEEKPELTKEQRQALAWMQYVSDEVNTLLAIFLPISRTGTVGVKYNKHVIAMAETGPEYDPDKADGVEVRLVFDFEGAVDIPKEPTE